MMRKLTLVVLLMTGACSMNPKLMMPAAPVPERFAAADVSDSASAAGLDWHQVFGDPRLHRLVDLALENNRDLRIAALNVDAARAQFRITRGAQLPQIDAQGAYTRQRTPTRAATAGFPGDFAAPPGVTGVEYGIFSDGAQLTSFEIDLFGRLRSQSQAAFQRYLATEEGRRAARIALIGAVTDGYLNQLLATEQLALTEQTLQDWTKSLDIARKLREARQGSGVEVAQAEGQVRQAEADLLARRRALTEAHNALQLLVGGSLPSDLPPSIALMDEPIMTRVPAGLTSELIANRPDIRQAEHDLVAANADVGAARAAFFPRISLTALAGFTSLGFAGLFTGDDRSWSFTPSITAPIFHGGSLKGSLQLAKVRKSIAVAQYERSIQIAFREVLDGIAGRETYGLQLEAQQRTFEAAHKRVELSNLRYRAGVDSRLELLDAQRTEYATRQTLLDLRRQQLSSAAALYRAVGGGDRRSRVEQRHVSDEVIG